MTEREIISKLMNYLLTNLGYDELQQAYNLTDAELKFCKDIVEDERDEQDERDERDNCDRFKVGDKVRYIGEPNGVSYPKTGSIGIVIRCDGDGSPLVKWSLKSGVLYNAVEEGFRWYVSDKNLVRLEN